MTKWERLSFALRRLRTVKAQGNIALRIQGTHEIIKEMIDELSSGTKSAELGQHTIEILDELYAQNTGAIEDGRLPAPRVMPDCAEQIRAQTQALQAITSDDAQTRRTETAAVLQRTLSLFGQGPNEEPIKAFLETFSKEIKWENALPTPWPDYSTLLQSPIDTLEALVHQDDPEAIGEAGTTVLCSVLSVFAQGPNEEPIQTLLGAVERLAKQKELCTRVPDDTPQIQPHIEALAALANLDDPDALTAAAAVTLYEALAEMAQGSHEAPIRALLDTFDKVTGAD